MKDKTFKNFMFSLAFTVVFSFGNLQNVHAMEDYRGEIIMEDDLQDFLGNSYHDYSIEENGVLWREVYIPQYVTSEYIEVSYEDGMDTSELSILRIDGNTYLATEVVDQTEDNIITKYYAIDTHEFLGQTITVDWYSRAYQAAKSHFLIDEDGCLKSTENLELKVSTNDGCHDQKYFNGEYGLGKNLPMAAVIPASKVFGNTRLSKKQIDLFLDNPIYAASYFDNYEYPSQFYQNKDNYTITGVFYNTFWQVMFPYSPYDLFYSVDTDWEYNYRTIFIFEPKDSVYRRIVGYRASCNPKDSGYHYIYDIETSRLIYLENYYKLDSDIPSPAATVTDIRKSLYSPMNRSYSLDELLVVGANQLIGDNNFQDYYIIKSDNCNGNQKLNESIKFTSIDVLSSDVINGFYDSKDIYIQSEDGKYSKSNESNGMNYPVTTLRSCLANNGMGLFVKETYSSQELETILNELRVRQLTFKDNIVQKRAKEVIQTVSLNDILVVDTTYYDEEFTANNSDNFLLNDLDQRYVILVPSELSNSLNSEIFSYYTSWNHALVAVITNNGIRIDALLKPLYCVSSTDPLQGVQSLEEFLTDLDLSTYIEEDYTLEDLGDLEDGLNTGSKVYKVKSHLK